MPIDNSFIKGKKFGKLTPIEIVGKKKRYLVWKCQCDCGKFCETTSTMLKLGRKKSCGCLLEKEGRWNWTGYKELSGFNWSRILNGAKERGIEVKITIQHAWELFEKQNRKCALTGDILTFPTKNSSYDGTASLDRIDSSKGYVEGNVQWVHKHINTIKWDLTQEDFIKWCKKVANYNS